MHNNISLLALELNVGNDRELKLKGITVLRKLRLGPVLFSSVSSIAICLAVLIKCLVTVFFFVCLLVFFVCVVLLLLLLLVVFRHAIWCPLPSGAIWLKQPVRTYLLQRTQQNYLLCTCISCRSINVHQSIT